MTQLPTIDARFLALGETKVLIDYANDMADLLRHRWEQREVRLLHEHRRDKLPEEECQMLMQYEQHHHAQFEALLGAQVLLTAWSMLEGSVHHCAAFLAEQKNIADRLDQPAQWPSELVPTKDVPVEEIWQIYYTKILSCEYPLTKEDQARVTTVRKLRNTYGHMLFFETASHEKRRPILERNQSIEHIEVIRRLEPIYTLDKCPGLEHAQCVDELVEKFRASIAHDYPATDRGITFWHRLR